jgi:hypothetical protein
MATTRSARVLLVAAACMYSCKLRVRAAGAIEPRVAGGVSRLRDLDLTIGMAASQGQVPRGPATFFRFAVTARRREVFSMPIFLINLLLLEMAPKRPALAATTGRTNPGARASVVG